MALFEVVVPYREPTYEVRIGRPEEAPPYRAFYRVRAVDDRGAIEEALRLFEEDRLESSVSWTRLVVADSVAARRVA